MTKVKKKEFVVASGNDGTDGNNVPDGSNECTGSGGNPDVVIVKSGEAAKLSPRGEGGILYQVGRIGEEVFIRIEKNTGGGSCSKEWVPVSTILEVMTPAMHKGDGFKTDALAGSFLGKSQCNSGFLVAVLRAEKLVAPDSTKKGLHTFVDSLESWARVMAQTNPVLTNEGVPMTAKRYLEPQNHKFKADPGTEDGKVAMIRKIRLIRKSTEAAVPDESVEPVDPVEPVDINPVDVNPTDDEEDNTP